MPSSHSIFLFVYTGVRRGVHWSFTINGYKLAMLSQLYEAFRYHVVHLDTKGVILRGM